MGQFLGFSDDHSSLVANVRYLRTGYVIHQCHVVFDDLFQTLLVWATMTLLCMQFVTSCLKIIRISVLRMNSVSMGN